MVNYTRHVVKGVAIISFFSLISGLLAYAARWIMAKNLSIEDYGLFYAVFTFLALIGAFKNLGMDYSLVKFIPEYKSKKHYGLIKSSLLTVLGFQLLTSTLMVVLIFIFSSYLSIHFFHTDKAILVLKWMAIAFFIDSFVSTIKFIMNGFQDNLSFSSIDALRMLLIIIILSIGVRMDQSLTAPLVAYSLTPLILLIVFSYILLKKTFPEFFAHPFAFKRTVAKQLLTYGLLSIASGVGIVILTYTDTIMITYFLGLKEVGLYNIALPTMTLLVFFPRIIASVLLPVTSELWAKKDGIKLKAGMENLYNYVPMIIVPASLGLIFFSDIFITTIFGAQYVGASSALRILCIGAIFLTITSVNSNFFAGIGKLALNNKIIYCGAALNLLLNLLFIPLWGIIGAAFSTMVSYLLMAIAGTLLMGRSLKISLPVNNWIKTLLASSLMVAVMWATKNVVQFGILIESLIIVAVSGTAYLLTLFLLRAVTIGEIKELYKRSRSSEIGIRQETT